MPPKPPVPAAALAAAALRLLEDRSAAVAAAAARSGDPWSPWNLQTAWRLNGDGYQDLVFETGEGPVALRAHPQGSGYRLDLPGRTVTLARAGEGRVAIDGAVTHASVLRDGEGFTVFAGGTQYRLTLVDPLAPSRLAVVSGGRLTAPMPGKITQILASAGSAVRRGAALMVLEAMKMEHTIAAPADGTVTEIRGAVGDLVDEGAELVVFASDPI